MKEYTNYVEEKGIHLKKARKLQKVSEIACNKEKTDNYLMPKLCK